MIRLKPTREPGVDEGVGHGAGLGDAGDAAARQVRRHVADVRALFAVRSTTPMQFGPDEGDAVPPGDVGHLDLHRGGGRAALDDAAARDDDGRDAGVRRVLR